MDQGPKFLVFLDLRKAYENTEWKRLLKTIDSYGALPKLWRLLAEFWSRQEVVNF